MRPLIITIRRPDDWHLHLRIGLIMLFVIFFTLQRFSRAIIMPNLDPAVITLKRVEWYEQKIQSAIRFHNFINWLQRKPEFQFQPLMTLYLTDKTIPDEVRRGIAERRIYGVKWYPKGATTNSDEGVTALENIFRVCQELELCGGVLEIHGEQTHYKDGEEVDPYDREREFIEVVREIRRRFPRLRIVLEHITTRDAVRFVLQEYRAGHSTAATITAHHLFLTRTDVFRKGLNVWLHCLPPAKRNAHRRWVRWAALSGLNCFFFGSDSAPHDRWSKETACACAGVFTAHVAIELCAEFFHQNKELDRLENFISVFGARFYGLPPNEEKITLIEKTQKIPGRYWYPTFRWGWLPWLSYIVPFRAGGKVQFSLKH